MKKRYEVRKRELNDGGTTIDLYGIYDLEYRLWWPDGGPFLYEADDQKMATRIAKVLNQSSDNAV